MLTSWTLRNFPAMRADLSTMDSDVRSKINSQIDAEESSQCIKRFSDSITAITARKDSPDKNRLKDIQDSQTETLRKMLEDVAAKMEDYICDSLRTLGINKLKRGYEILTISTKLALEALADFRMTRKS